MRTSALLFSFLFILSACQKSEPTPPLAYSKNYSQVASANSNTGGAFSFTSIELNPGTIQIGNVAQVTAHATGNNLTYSWSTPHGDIFGTGRSVYYSDSCIGTYAITCTVSDGTNSKTITVQITITN